MQPILQINQVRKGFSLPDGTPLAILRDLSLQVERGKLVAITGASGVGKSTLLHLVGALDHPDAGAIIYQGRSLSELNAKEIASYRNRAVGFIFQFHYLMPELNVLENVAAPRLLRAFERQVAYAAAGELLAEVGLADRQKSMPHHLSGGEKQRVAIARSLINQPELLLADEPTGNLDWQTGETVFALMRAMVRSRGLTAIVVTHNPRIAVMADICYLLHQGVLELQSSAGRSEEVS
jgi:lipoprotein-releasing system ATP-binding protein